ncbi:HPr family phosphocarrier protein [Gordonia desulfuricans]|uniref:Phosphocarrier protein HPr n=1 Tax=Gordonia desulfuricans TaxID=89051 RepID=A0A7K3LMG2_9ACTN|nr:MULTISPECIES: HPr family phosphocarrier protein [Gordonia]KOY49885.1 serine kinase [Gordonia sp. NB41Y]NDK89444.1 HPr family phosphocarrier protein [Gordonia desulfuricans]WLP91102.1 HPr family phosphocarrier protein [Gordonia sp. NB41Y]
MPSTTVAVGSAVGLHARPATIIADAAAGAAVPVTLSLEGGEPVDAGSALMIMTLGAEKGTNIVVSADDAEVLATIAELVAKDLDAE